MRPSGAIQIGRAEKLDGNSCQMDTRGWAVMQEPAEQAALIEIRLFGPFAAQVEGQPLPRVRTRKGQSLLALLALRQGREVSRDWLAGTLWPDSSESQASFNLRQCLSDLR